MILIKSSIDEVHSSKVNNTEDQPIVIPSFIIDITPILNQSSDGGGGNSLMSIQDPNTCNYHNGVRKFYPQVFKSLQDQCLKLQELIDIDMCSHMDNLQLVSEILGKCGMFWCHLKADIEDFHLHMVASTYGKSASGSGGAEFWPVVLMVVQVILR